MGMQPDLQKRIYDQYWYPMEVLFGHAEYSSYFDRFMRDYLTTKINRIPNISNVHKEFKYYSSSSENGEIESIVADIYKYAKYFLKMVLGKETNQILKAAFESINQLKVDVIYPFLLQVYNDYQSEVIKEDDFLEILGLLESYIFRRAICGIPTNSMNKTFATLYKEIDKENYLESLKAVFILKDSYRKFPTNEEFMRNLTSKDVYNFRNRNYLLAKLENSQLEKEPVNLDKYSIEHILPQNPNLSDAWKADLGEKWKDIQSKYLHTIGNLTLTGYNSELSDKLFIEKRDLTGGFRNSGLFLNSHLRDLSIWNEAEIIHRANLLADIAKDVWVFPELDGNVIQKYIDLKIVEKKIIAEYSLIDYPYLTEWRLELYHALRTKIMAIDAGITEQFNKHYVVFKSTAESNFVCITPQKSKVKISLAIKFEDILDPISICSNIESIGSLGGLNTLFDLKQGGDIEYAMELIKQSYEIVLLD
jgi:predicted transport protein